MKIKSIRLFNHLVLGDTYFDFNDHNNDPVDTIIIAGENGTGKSVLLNLIYEFANCSLDSNQRNEKRIFEIILSPSEIDILKSDNNFHILRTQVFKDNYFKIVFNYNIINNWDQIKITSYDTNNVEVSIPSHLFNNENNKRILKTIFSDVEINFTPDDIRNVTSKDLDQIINHSIRSSTNMATEISQLLVDVQTLDALEFNDWAKNNVGGTIDESRLDLRMKRFTFAFNSMFPTKRFKRITNENGKKSILFEEYGNEIPMNNLSSGEKQIVFRGGFLLKDKKSSDGAIILIDEPEISMHPLWQLKILDFFKKLFTDESGTQTSQIIIATHSPFILHNCNRYNDKVIILARGNSGKIQIQSDPEFINWTQEEIIEKAFNIDFKNDIDNPIVFVEGETDEKYFNKTIQVFNRTDIIFKVKWVGRSLGGGKVEFSGDTALNQTKLFFLANERYLKSKVILLYDSDTNKSDENLGNLLIRKMLINQNNTLYKKGIENNLTLPLNFPKDTFYKESTKTNEYGAESIIRDLDKNKLCDWICNSLSEDEQKKYMANLNNMLDILKECFK